MGFVRACKYDHQVCVKKWATFGDGSGGGLTLGSLFFWATQTGWVRPKRDQARRGTDPAKRVAQRGDLCPLDRIPPTVERPLATDEPGHVFGNPKAMFSLACMADANPGGFAVI